MTPADLPGAPTPVHLLTAWQPDPVFGVAALAVAVAYLATARRLRRRGEPWPAGRTTAWLAGCALVFVVTSSGVGAYAPTGFSTHMTLHMVLNMLAPLLLVLGGPVTLASRVIRRAWLSRLTTSPPARVLARPALAAVSFVASYYLLYFTPLFGLMMSDPWSRAVLNVWALVAGYQFYWIIVGVDPSPRPVPHLGRLAVVFAVMPFHAVFAVAVISTPDVLAAGYFRGLALPWATDLLADQRLGGVVSLVAGEVALVAAQVVLLVQWYRHDRMGGFRSTAEDEDTAAYRAMLATLKRNRNANGGRAGQA